MLKHALKDSYNFSWGKGGVAGEQGEKTALRDTSKSNIPEVWDVPEPRFHRKRTLRPKLCADALFSSAVSK